MKVENLEKAFKLKEELRKINVKIKTVDLAESLSIKGSNGFNTSTENMKYDTNVLLNSVKLLFLNALNREKEDILKEINLID